MHNKNKSYRVFFSVVITVVWHRLSFIFDVGYLVFISICLYSVFYMHSYVIYPCLFLIDKMVYAREPDTFYYSFHAECIQPILLLKFMFTSTDIYSRSNGIVPISLFATVYVCHLCHLCQQWIPFA